MRKQRICGAIMAVLLLVCSMPTAVRAGEASTGQLPDSISFDVRAKKEGTTETPVRYLVDVEWGAMEFTYTAAGVSIWNPETHEYEVTVEDQWSGHGNTVTVKNHSNAAVEAALDFQAADGYNLTGSFDTSLLKLASAEGTKPEEAPFATAEFMLSGTMDSQADSYHTVGQINVAVK
ncbi:MAG: hypothetical protein Q4C91_21455 [Eubacteriales bacterium]|nr:hypothetical protein [Eubacteriales bacterium]